MSSAAARLLEAALKLNEADRAALATELLASLEGPADTDWDAAWLAELDRRVAAAAASGETGSDWSDARRRILDKLTSR